jgi:hypothetical protein
MILLIRLLPFLVAALEAVLFWWQRALPGAYPWFAILGVSLLPAAAIAIGWGRVRIVDALEKTVPTFVLLASLAFALLLIEGTVALWIVIGIAAIASFASLELLFLHAWDPAAYPVNGLSHVNIAMVPIAVWYAVSTSVGLRIFLQTSIWWHLALLTALGAVLFRTTAHPGATADQRRTWTLLGALAGLQIGVIGLQLPIGMQMQGIVAALLFCGVLRARRYVHDPKPSRTFAFAEAGLAVAVFTVALATAKWL